MICIYNEANSFLSKIIIIKQETKENHTKYMNFTSRCGVISWNDLSLLLYSLAIKLNWSNKKRLKKDIILNKKKEILLL